MTMVGVDNSGLVSSRLSQKLVDLIGGLVGIWHRVCSHQIHRLNLAMI